MMKRRPAGPRWADLGRRLGYYLLLRAADKREGEAGWPETAQQGREKRFSIFCFQVLKYSMVVCKYLEVSN
jgi:hypothetical protein